MKLYYDRKSTNPTYFVQQGLRVNGKSTTKNVLVIGRHETLKKEHPDIEPLEYAKKFVDELNSFLKDDQQIDELNLTINLKEKLLPNNYTYSKSTLLNIGYFYLKKIYYMLNIPDFMDSIQQKYKAQFDFNQVNEFLTYARILEPCSKFSTFDKLGTYYEKPDFQYHDIERFLPILNSHYNEYIAHLFKNSENIVKRNTTICYYDCTNFYFEIEQEDGYIDEVTGEVMDDGLRQYGYSKEHRPNPIVGMGLFIDGNGIPISMSIHRGNQNEQETAIPLETEMIKMFKDKKLIYCADAGLGSINIKTFNTFGDKAFIVTQSIKKLGEDLQKKVFEDKNYKLLSNNKDISLQSIRKFDKYDKNNEELYSDFAYKTLEMEQTIDLGITEMKQYLNGNTREVKSKGKLKQILLITFSRKTQEYQRYIRNRQVERARELIKNRNPEDIKKSPTDIKRFIKNKNKGVKEDYIIDEELIKKEEKYDGFYAIATNLEFDDPKKIIQINSNRWRIEECFRILKTNFQSRPVYHRNGENIKAHFLICYTSLLIYRILERKLKEEKYRFTINEIIKTLKNMNIVEVGKLYYEAAYTNSTVLNALDKVLDLNLDYQRYSPKTLKKRIKNIEEEKSHTTNKIKCFLEKKA